MPRRAVDIAIESLEGHEGFRAMPYRDHLGNLTIGYGTNLEDGIDRFEAAAMLRARVLKKEEELLAMEEHRKWYTSLNSARRAVILEMIYQLGMAGFLKFERTIAWLRTADWLEASEEMLDSRWAQQTPNRARTLSQIMRDGYRKVS